MAKTASRLLLDAELAGLDALERADAIRPQSPLRRVWQGFWPKLAALVIAVFAWQLEGAKLKGNLELHLVCAITSSLLIVALCWMRSRLRAKLIRPGITYIALTLLAVIAVTLTGHVGGILSGVETP